MTGHCANYDFILDTALSSTEVTSPKVLDFGCGQGQVVALGMARGIDIHGADTFDGAYEFMGRDISPETRARIGRIEEGRLPFPDSHFDVVLSNTVFEHIPDPRPSLAEIKRVLKPGGVFLAFFPTRDVWFEGHLGIYFVHWMARHPEMRRRYLLALRRAGFGYHDEQKTPELWADTMGKVLDETIFYHAWPDVRRWWENEFGAQPQSLDTAFMSHRIRAHPRFSRLAWLVDSPLAAPFVRFLCHKRAGRALLVRRIANEAAR
jgi:SAM-dependent methyltransferase